MTELLARAGDEEAQRIFRAHHDLLAETAGAHGGKEVKWLGDGLMVAFPSAADAVRAAIAMQQAARRPIQAERLAIRVGLNAGEALRDATAYFGLPVVVARRLCDRAAAGQILCANVVAELLAGRTSPSPIWARSSSRAFPRRLQRSRCATTGARSPRCWTGCPSSVGWPSSGG